MKKTHEMSIEELRILAEREQKAYLRRKEWEKRKMKDDPEYAERVRKKNRERMARLREQRKIESNSRENRT